MSERLTAAGLRAWRVRTLKEQGGVCALCGQPLSEGEAVGDHDHTTGRMRGVLHRGCNSALGKIENHRRIAGLTDIRRLTAFLHGVVPYVYQKVPESAPLYHTYRSADEKRELRNKRARAATAARRARKAE